MARHWYRCGWCGDVSVENKVVKKCTNCGARLVEEYPLYDLCDRAVELIGEQRKDDKAGTHRTPPRSGK